MLPTTFISYKHGEGVVARNRFAELYRGPYVGETDCTPDLREKGQWRINKHIKGMIAKSAVTVILLSPKMFSTAWATKEIRYSLKYFKYGNHLHQPNGIVAVVLKSNGTYDWVQKIKKKQESSNKHGKIYCGKKATRNMLRHIKNRLDTIYTPYISLVTEDAFFENPEVYVCDAYHKSKSFSLIRNKHKIEKNEAELIMSTLKDRC